MKTTKTVVITIIIEIVIFVAFIFSGFYNVSALHPDPGIVQWVFSTTSDRSVEHHAKNIKMPNLNDSTMVAHGFDHYNEMCVGCHGAPGVKRGEGGKGLFPKPPDLTESAKEMPPKELFWIVKNGIKSTGMPAFGKTHSNKKIDYIIAFMEKMKTMSPQQYAQMKKQVGEHHDEDGD
ncbi:MAG TPA: cytochrome c [Balneolales bacterium]|nr:cytochrome c [Balneolales bacterium]